MLALKNVLARADQCAARQPEDRRNHVAQAVAHPGAAAEGSSHQPQADQRQQDEHEQPLRGDLSFLACDGEPPWKLFSFHRS